MNLKKMLKKKHYQGGITSYVIIMFGLIVVMYLFGFTSAWNAYASEDMNREIGTGDDATTIEDPNMFDSDFSIGDMMVQGIMTLFTTIVEGVTENPLLGIIGTVIAGAGAILILRAGGAYALGFIIPIVIITLFANIFIFPIEPITTETTSMSIASGIPISILLVAFFNIFLFLSIIEFVRGT